MAGGRILRARGRGQLLGCGIQLGALAWLVLVSGVWAALFPLLPHHLKDFIAPIALMSWLGTMLPPLLLVLLLVTHRRNRRLDRAFAAYGPGRALAPVARAWEAQVEGRQLNAWFSKGPQLELYLSARPRTRGGIGRDNRLGRMAASAAGQETLELEGGMVASGKDAAWMRRFVDASGCREALDELLADDGRSLRALTLQPDAVKLTLRYLPMSDVTASNVVRWVGQLGTLAQVADALPPPAEPLEPGGMAARLRTNRGGPWTLLAVVLGTVVVVLGCSGGITGVVLLLGL